MTIYIAIKAQWLTIKIAPLQQEDQHDLLNMNINESWILMNHWRELLSVCPLSGTNFTPLWWDELRCDYNLLYCVLPIYACVAPGSNGDRLQCGTMAVACLLCPTLNFIKLDLLLQLFFLALFMVFIYSYYFPIMHLILHECYMMHCSCFNFMAQIFMLEPTQPSWFLRHCLIIV